MVTVDADIPAELSKLESGYELLGELSREELVTTYLARDRQSGREVAIKVLRAAATAGREALAHYASDARMLTALEHPNIVAVHGVKWLSEDVVAVITERVRGPSLRQVLDVAGTLPVARATEVLRGLGRALAWAHSSQIMQRDLRPENVIFEDGTGRVVLSDFGLVRRVEGTPATSELEVDPYRAPELTDGRYPDRRSDVFSLGIVGWELLTGRRPWPDDMEPAVPGQRAPAPPPLAEIRPGLPEALVAAIEGAVQLDRERRITDVVTFMERLTTVAPPTPEAEDDEQDAEMSFEPKEWLALPMPKLAQRLRKRAARAEAIEQAAPPEPAVPSAAAPVTPPADAPVDDAVSVPTPPQAADEPELAPSVAGSEVPAGVRQHVVGDSSPAADSGEPARVSGTAMPAVGAVVAGAAAVVPEPTEAPARVAPLPGEAGPSRTANAGATLTTPRADKAATSDKIRPDAKGAPTSDKVRPGEDSSRSDKVRLGDDLPSVSDEVRLGEDAPLVSDEVRLGEEAPLVSDEVRLDDDVRLPAIAPQPAPMSRAEKRRRSKNSDLPPVGVDRAAAPPATPRTGPPAASSMAGATFAEPSPASPARPTGWRADSARAGAPLADAPPSEAPVADTFSADSTRHKVPLADAPAKAQAASNPSAVEPPSGKWSAPIDVELPPPEPVPLADVSQPLTGPISGPVRGAASPPPPRAEPAMRGGLGRPRPRRSGGRDAVGPGAAPPLQPMWDTPAEFPLPVMPDPRPMPADGSATTTTARRRWTRRGVMIAGAVALAVIGVLIVVRMERAPDTTSVLMQPESPTGYGGDVALEPRTGDTTSVRGATSARPGGTSTGSRSTGASSGPPSDASVGTSRPTGSGVRAPAATRSAPPAARPGPASGASVTPTPPRGASAAPATTLPPATSRNTPSRSTPSRSTPSRSAAARTPPAGESNARPSESPPRAAAAPVETTVESRPVAAAPCNSPGLADQRACLSAQIERSDASLNQVYGQVIVAMRQRANSAPGDPDPPEVQRLRAVQRAWLVRRDAECRQRGRGREGPLWATPRAQCLAEFSAERSRDLSNTLSRLRRD